MTTPRILINGASGRMGRALLRLGAAEPDVSIAAAVSRQTIGWLNENAPAGYPWIAIDQLSSAPEFDVLIDFSLPTALDRVVALCTSRGAGLVCGTTGLSAEQMSMLSDASLKIPVLWSANFSLGIAVLKALVQHAAASLPQWDIDIIEQHHTRKLDAPSGTALALGDSAAVGSARMAHFHSLRAGDIVGEHSVQFSGVGERLELIHRATDRDVFAHGALFAARWLAHRAAGRYQLEDALVPFKAAV